MDKMCHCEIKIKFFKRYQQEDSTALYMPCMTISPHFAIHTLIGIYVLYVADIGERNILFHISLILQ